MKNNISLLVGLKNNLEYNKHFYNTTRELYPDVELCFVSYGSTDGTHEWLETLSDNNLNYFYSTENKTFSDTFNKAAELATKDYVAYLHNDIVLAPGFLENLEKHVAENNVVAYTTIEPPIFADHERPGKIIHDLGVELETFSKDALYEFVNSIQPKYSDKTEPGITFFMCMPRIKLLNIGGMDNLFNPMFCEDDDLIARWKMLGMNCFTALDAICYHFVSKTSRFSDEYQHRTQQIEAKSIKNFIRKWGTRNLDLPKYNIAFRVENCSQELLGLLEPWCNRIYSDAEWMKYITLEQPNTKFDLRQRCHGLTDLDRYDYDDIVVEINGTRFTQQDYEIIQKLSAIIQDSGEPGLFELSNLKITIVSIQDYKNELIICK
jgi:GT2 family glycosyltransferase